MILPSKTTPVLPVCHSLLNPGSCQKSMPPYFSLFQKCHLITLSFSAFIAKPTPLSNELWWVVKNTLK
jgi:hypothetical protein